MTPQKDTKKNLLPIYAGGKPAINNNTRAALAKMSEAQLQAQCYQWAYNTYPKLRGLFFAVPNGGTRNMREAQALKAQGLTPGIPDMILICRLPFQNIATVYAFEFKTATGKMSEAQEKIHTIWHAEKIPLYIVRDFEYFKSVLKFLLD